MSVDIIRVVQIEHCSRNRRGLYHYLIVAPAPRNRGEHHDQNLLNYIARPHSLKEAWHKEIVGLLHMLSGRPHPSKCRDVQTGCFKCGQESHLVRECPKNTQGGNPGNSAQSSVSPKNRQVEIYATEPNLHHLIHQIGKHLKGPLMVLAEGQTPSMQSLGAKRKRTH